jgi:choline dehydrogenase-like flavoprotein
MQAVFSVASSISTAKCSDIPDLPIADGSVMPGPVGPNPSFTIAALADRFADHQLGRPIVPSP